MPRHREYASNAAKQLAYRQRKQAALLATIPQKQIGDCTLYQGDSAVIVPLLGAVDHIITDPPYGDTATHAKHVSTVRLRDGSHRQPLGFAGITRGACLTLARRWVQVARRWVVFTCERRYIQAIDDAGLLVREGHWIKPNGAPQKTGDRPGMGWEAVAICHRAGRKYWNGGGRHAAWTHNVPHGTTHPTEKPLGLFRDFVAQFTDPGELILDPYMGVGTTGVAAAEAGRRFIGIERDARYFQVAADRLALAVAQGQLFPVPTPPAHQPSFFA